MKRLILRWDNRALRMMQQELCCPLLDRIMPQVTRLGDWGFLWAVWAFLFICFPRYRDTGVLMVVGMGLGAVICNMVMKPLFCRERPFEKYSQIHLLIPPPPDRSFPSGHTMASFIAVVILWQAGWPFGVLALAAACAIGFSRVYLSVHFLSDVVGGALLGSITGFLCLHLAHPAAQVASNMVSRLFL